MTSIASRGLVVAVVALVACSLALGAAPPVVAGDGHSEADPSGVDLGLDEAVDDAVDVAGDTVIADGENVSHNGSDLENGTANATADGTTTDTEDGTDRSDGTATGSGTGEETPEPTPAATSTAGSTAPDATSTDEATADGTSATDATPTTEQTSAGTDADRTTDPGLVGDVGGTVESVGDTTSRTVDGTVTGVGSTVEETANATGGAVDGTVNATGGAVDGTVNATGETVAGTAGGTGTTVEGTTNATTGVVEDATDGVTDAVENTTNATRGAVDDTASTTTDGVTDVTAEIDRSVADVTGSVRNVSVDGDGDLLGVVDGTTAVLRRTTDALTAAAGGAVSESGGLLGDVVAASTGDGVIVGGNGQPTTGDGSASGIVGSWSSAGTDASTLEQVDSDERAGTAGAGDSGGAGADGDGSSGGGVDPASGGAAVGAALLIGSLVATRSGTAASSMGAGAAALPRTLFALLREFGFRLAVLAGYSRYDFDDPLENENRAAVLTAVESSPGVNLASLVETTGLAESTVRYHLRVLEDEDLLEAAKVRGRRRYVPRTDDDVEFLAAFEEEATKAVLEALFEHEPATGTTLAEALDRDPSTVSHHLSRLADAGLVDREQDGPALRNSLTPKVRRAFADVETTPARRGFTTADD